MNRRIWLAGWLALPSALAAQSGTIEPSRAAPAWLDAWSPLLPRGDLLRSLPGATGNLPLLLLPVPSAGLFWTAGNPAALGRDLPAPRSDFSFGLGRQNGTYRRPLDPAQTSLGRLSGSSLGRIAPTTAMLGRVVLERATDTPGSQSDIAEPYGSSPFVTTDTSISTVRRNRVVLEGASSWTMGAWAAGVALGIEARDQQSTEASVIRRLSRTMPGITAGVTRRVGGLDIGLQGGLRYRSETVRLSERSDNTIVYELAGYRAVKPLEVSTAYDRWTKEFVPSLGAAVGGRTGTVAWTASGERVWRHEHQTVQLKNDPAEDLWNADGWRGALAVEPNLGGNLRALLHFRYDGLSGTGREARDSAEATFTARERLVEATGELRLTPARVGITGVVVLSVRHERWKRADSVAALETDITGLSPSLQVELGYTWAKTLVALTGALRHYRPTATLPNPTSLSPFYQRLIAPELDVYTRAATPYSLGLVFRREVSHRTTVWLSSWWEHLAPADVLGRYTWSPSGTRTGWKLETGITLVPGESATGRTSRTP